MAHVTVFTDAEYMYLTAASVGRLATTGPSGAPQNHPVWFRVDRDTGTIDVGAIDLRSSQKYRNVLADPRVSLVVDEEAPEPLWPGGDRGRGVEIRGTVEIVRRDPPLFAGFGEHVFRIRPRRIVAWNLDGPGYNNRTST